ADAQAVAAGRAALEELAELATAEPALVGGAPEIASALAGLDVRIGDEPGAGRVEVTDPLAIRARRVRALIVCGLQAGGGPRAGTSRPRRAPPGAPRPPPGRPRGRSRSRRCARRPRCACCASAPRGRRRAWRPGRPVR